jgi:hypothetical protein
MVSLSSLASKVAIAPETEPVYVLADGSVRNATAEDPDDGNLIVAEKDMLPVARDSDLRSWGMASMAGVSQVLFSTKIHADSSVASTG